MITTYLRSSSYNRLDWCELLFYAEYVLGRTSYSGKKAEAGNFIHKSMEMLALIKKAQQDNIKIINEPGIGELDVDNYCLDDIFNRSCQYYLKKSPHQYTKKEMETYRGWLTKALEYQGGLYDPRNHTILGVEHSFDITIPDEWARYEYELGGQKYVGQYSIKGNVDIVTKYSDTCIELLDYKTGKRKDWNHPDPNHVKDYKDLMKDPQLQIYYYALAHLYPDKDILISIFYINDGGVFTLPFERSSLGSIKDMLRKRFDRIKSIEMPKLLSPKRTHFKCKNMCHASKQMVGDKTLCEHIHTEIKEKGIQKATEDNIVPGFNLQAYGDGGGSTGLKEKDVK